MFQVLDKACDANYEIFFLENLNIDWNVRDCPLKAGLLSLADTCYLSSSQEAYKNMQSSTYSTCIDLIFTNVSELCSKVTFIPIGCSDHNLIAIGRKTKIPKGGQKVTLQTNL